MPDQMVYRVRAVSAGWPGAPGLNTFYFDLAGEGGLGSSTTAAECAARVHSAFSAIVDIWPAEWTCQVDSAVDVINTDNGDLEFSYPFASPALITGTRSEGFGPEAAMVCLNWHTSGIVDGRRVRGRVFLGPLAPRTDHNGTPDATVLSRVNSFAGIIETVPMDGNPPTVWSRRRPASTGHPTGLGGSSHIVLGHSVRDTYAVLRSRRQ